MSRFIPADQDGAYRVSATYFDETDQAFRRVFSYGPYVNLATAKQQLGRETKTANNRNGYRWVIEASTGWVEVYAAPPLLDEPE